MAVQPVLVYAVQNEDHRLDGFLLLDRLSTWRDLYRRKVYI